MLDFLKKLPPGKSVALYALGSQLRMVHSFTEKPDELIAAARELSTRAHGAYSNAKEFSAAIDELKKSLINARALAAMVRFMGEEYRGKLESRARYTLDGFTQLAHALAIVPGRKNVIWISAGLPFDFSSNAQEWQKVAGLLAANRMAIYPVDARGIAFLGADGQVRGSEAFSLTEDYETRSGQGEENDSIIETMQTIADTTGGRAYVNDNDLEAALADSMQTGSNYYTLAYRPAGVEWNGQIRKTSITTARPHVKLLYRSGYYAISDPSHLKEDVSRIMAMAMLPGVPVSTQFIMKARVIPPELSDEASLCLALEKCSNDFFCDWHSGFLPRLVEGCRIDRSTAAGFPPHGFSTFPNDERQDC